MALDKEETITPYVDATTQTTTTTTQTTEPQTNETIGSRARQLSEKHFETKSSKIVNSIIKRVLQASGKGLWRVQVKLPNNLWTSDKENQRRLLQRLKEVDLAAWIKSTPTSVLVSVSWSQYDLEHPIQAQEDLEASENVENEKSFEDRTPESILNYVTERNESAPPKLQSFREFESETNEREESSEIDKKERKLKRLIEKEQIQKLRQEKKEARQKEIEATKQARKEERMRLKQTMKEKRKEGKKKEERKQKKLSKQKEKEERKNKGGKKKNKEKKKSETSSSEDERTWSHSDLSATSSDSETNSD